MRTRIIDQLKKTEGFVSGEDLSRMFGVSRAAVWKTMEDLRAEGYQIEAVPHHGYSLRDVPDKLLPTEVQYRLGTRKFGCDVRHFDEIPSTMDEAFRLGMEGASEGTLVIAETQSQGRGRLGRRWVSSRGKGIYCSLLLRPALSLGEASRLTLLAAVVVSEAVEKVAGVEARIKWPNDLLVGGRKLAGILTELRAEVDRVSFAVVGIGINVNTPAAQLPPEAVSLKEAAGHEISRVALLQEILGIFEKRYLAIRKDGFGPSLQEWRARSATIGTRVRFEDRGKKKEGLAVDLRADGALLVRLDSGEIVARVAGDIILLDDKKDQAIRDGDR